MWLVLRRLAPYIIAAAAAAGLIWYVHDAGYTAGQNAQRVKCDAQLQRIQDEYDAATQSARDEQERLREQAVDQARAYWQANAERQVVTEYIDREVVKYVERENSQPDRCQLDADFLRIWNAANGGRAGAGDGAG